MAIIAATLRRIKSGPLALLGGAERVNECFTQAGHAWRDCVLDPATTLAMFVLQVLNGNTSMAHLRLLSGGRCAESSYCEARKRLPAAGVAAVVEQLSCDHIRCNQNDSRWLGRRVLMTDGTTAAAPDTPELQELWPQPSGQKPGCGFPIIKMLALMDLASGMVLQLTIMCRKVHEMSQLAGMHGMLLAGDVLLGDRAFCSFAHLHLLLKMSVDAVFRMHQRQIVDFTPNRPHRGKSKNKGTKRKRGGTKPKPGVPTSRFVKKLGDQDQLVEWTRPESWPVWMTFAQFLSQPPTLLIRELRYQITIKGYRTREVTIATTLLDPMRYPKRQIARLYKLRWEIETNFRHLKTTLKMEHLKCQSADGVIKELMVFALVYNLVRTAMIKAAQSQKVADANRISFIGALRWVITLLPAVQHPVPLLVVNPTRPNRTHPRVKKRRMKEYDLMNKPRCKYAEPTEPTVHSIVGS
jgi:Transposase DDE domain